MSYLLLLLPTSPLRRLRKEVHISTAARLSKDQSRGDFKLGRGLKFTAANVSVHSKEFTSLQPLPCSLSVFPQGRFTYLLGPFVSGLGCKLMQLNETLSRFFAFFSSSSFPPRNIFGQIRFSSGRNRLHLTFTSP